MALNEDLQKSGNWLFRWRSFLPIGILAIFLLAMGEFKYLGNSETLDHYWEGFCFFISFIGLVIRAITVGYTPKGTSGRNTKWQVADTLNTEDIYSIVRNPLYLGNFFMWLGIALFVHIWWLTLIYVFIFWLYYERIIFAEEAYLTNKFGAAYYEWANVTPVFVPNFSRYKKSGLSFSFKNVLRREYNGVFAAIMAMFLFEVVGDYFYEGMIHLDVYWVVILAITFTGWLVLRTLKRHTTWLNVVGR